MRSDSDCHIETLSQSPLPLFATLCVLIEKCHCKMDNQCMLLLLISLLYLKVMAFSRGCHIRITKSQQQQQQQQEETGH